MRRNVELQDLTRSRGAKVRQLSFRSTAAVAVLWFPLVAAAQAPAARDLRLVDAARRSDHAAMRQLLQARVDVNTPGSDGGTALLVAAERDDAAAVELLLAAQADVKAANRYGVT